MQITTDAGPVVIVAIYNRPNKTVHIPSLHAIIEQWLSAIGTRYIILGDMNELTPTMSVTHTVPTWAGMNVMSTVD